MSDVNSPKSETRLCSMDRNSLLPSASATMMAVIVVDFVEFVKNRNRRNQLLEILEKRWGGGGVGKYESQKINKKRYLHSYSQKRQKKSSANDIAASKSSFKMHA